MNTLSIAIIQTALKWENPSKNRAHFDILFQSKDWSSTDIVVLPEMFNTGFSLSSKTYAESMDGKTISWLKEHALQYNMVICGSLMIRENNHYYNRFVWVQPDGEIHSYDKKHLFAFAHENQYFSPGTTKKIINYKGWKICPQVCYDLRFPVWARNQENYDLLIYVANWPSVRAHAFNTLLKARAIENQAYVVASNIVGQDGNGIDYQGDSSFIDYRGHLLATSQRDEIIHISIDKTPLDQFKSQKPFWKDKDDFILI